MQSPNLQDLHKDLLPDVHPPVLLQECLVLFLSQKQGPERKQESNMKVSDLRKAIRLLQIFPWVIFTGLAISPVFYL